MSGGLPSLMIVDDEPGVLSLVYELLNQDYRIRVATSGQRALELLEDGPLPELLLLDVMMPEMDGYELCSRLQGNPRTREIPVIFMTACTELEDEVRALHAGAVDYLTKPLIPPVLRARIHTHMSLHLCQLKLNQQTRRLEELVDEHTRELSRVQEATLMAVGSLAETRDHQTGHHIRRTQHYVRVLAWHLGHQPAYAEVLSAVTIDCLYRASALHDIGKVGVPDSLLLKPGPLTAQEFEVVKQHTVLGRDALRKAQEYLDGPSDFLSMAQEIAYSHHEKWDGSGYPEGLAGSAIPLTARIMAVADVYDALISRRVYKQPMGHEQAVQVIEQGRGSHFDPDLVAAFLEVAEDFRSLAERYPDQVAPV